MWVIALGGIYVCMYVCVAWIIVASHAVIFIFALDFLYGYWVKLPWYLSTKRHSEFKKVKSHNDRRTGFCCCTWKWYGKDCCVVIVHWCITVTLYVVVNFSERSTTIWCGRHCWWSYRWKWTTGWQICKIIDDMHLWGILRKGHDDNDSGRLSSLSSFE